MAVEMEGVVEVELEMSVVENEYQMKLIKMENDLKEEIKKLDLDMDMEMLLKKVKIFKAVLHKSDDIKKMIEKDNDKPEIKPLGGIENHCVKSGRFDIEIPEICDGEKTCTVIGNETTPGCNIYEEAETVKQAGSAKKTCKNGNIGANFENGKYTVFAVSCKTSIGKILDHRERKLFSDAWNSKTVKKLADHRCDYREKLNRLNPPSKTTVLYFASLKEVTKTTDFAKINFVVKQKAENYAKMYDVIDEKDTVKEPEKGSESADLKSSAPTVPLWFNTDDQKSHSTKMTEQSNQYGDLQVNEDSETSSSLSYILQQLREHQKNPAEETTAKNFIAETFTGEFELKPFTGSPLMSFESWQTQFEYSLAFIQIPPSAQQKLARLLANLQGAAKLAYEEYDDDVKQNYDQLTAALRTSFTNAAAKRNTSYALSYCRQQHDESVHDFSTRLTELVRTALDGEQPATVKAVLTFQLKEKIRDDIKSKINLHECNTYEEVLQKAINRENYVNQKAHFAKKSTPVDSNFSEEQKLKCNLHQQKHFAHENEHRRQHDPGNRSYRKNNYRNNHQHDSNRRQYESSSYSNYRTPGEQQNSSSDEYEKNSEAESFSFEVDYVHPKFHNDPVDN
uniref:Retrotransposon gag domain-containing protein n=1 Tax=Panagrolaimus sp. ES5 TaxID=591445 RepID=A0AC34G5W5_9BILA